MGKGPLDAYSDLDVFILCEDPYECLIAISPRLARKLRAVSVSSVGFTPGFGLYSRFILENGQVIEIFANNRATLAPSCMRQATNIVYDRSGYYTEFISRQSQQECIRESWLEESVHEYLSDLTKLRKAIFRKNVFAVLYRLHRLRRVVVAFEYFQSTSICVHPHEADKLLDSGLSNIGQMFVKQEVGPTSVQASISALHEQSSKFADPICQRHVSSSNISALVETLWTDIEEYARCLQS